MQTSPRDRIFSAMAALLVVAGGMAALVIGLASTMTPRERRTALAAIMVETHGWYYPPEEVTDDPS